MADGINLGGEVLGMDANFRNAMGGIAAEDKNHIVNARFRKATGHLLVESSNALQSQSLFFKEVTAVEAGATVSYGASVAWVNFINDDNQDDAWIRLGSLVATTDSSLAYRLHPGDVLDLDGPRLPVNLTEAVLTTLPGKMVVVRVSAGLTL